MLDWCIAAVARGDAAPWYWASASLVVVVASPGLAGWAAAVSAKDWGAGGVKPGDSGQRNSMPTEALLAQSGSQSCPTPCPGKRSLKTP